jgi:hypothetical protein
MKRWLILAILVVALTAAGTVVLQTLPADTPTPGQIEHPAPLVTEGPKPKVVVDGDLTHHFDIMAQETTDEKVWKITNEGPGNLLLKKGPSTCSCTIVNFKESTAAVLKPKESTEIRLTGETRTNTGQVSQSASILTNDPEKPQLDFIVEGTVRPAIVLFPPTPTVNYLTISNTDEDHKYKIAVTSPDKPDLKIIKLSSSKPDLIVAEQTPLTESECKDLKVEAGIRVTINAKAGLPLGAFREELIIETDHPLKPEVRLTVTGKMEGPISVSPERVRLFDVPSRVGGRTSIRLLVRGSTPTTFEVESKPENLKVEIAPSDSPPKEGRYQMIVTIPPGTPPGWIDDQIILKTNHPKAGELHIPVDVRVGSAG